MKWGTFSPETFLIQKEKLKNREKLRKIREKLRKIRKNKDKSR